MTTTAKHSSKKNTKNPWTKHDADLLHRKYHPRHLRMNPKGNANLKGPENGNCYDCDYDYIIIGSGIGGLWLGACLAKFNVTSLVLEQHTIAGGFQHTFRRGPYEFVPGLHYIANLPLCRPLYEMVATPTDPPLRFHRSGDAVPADRSVGSASDPASSGGEGCSHTLQVGSLPILQVRPGLESVRSELLRVFPHERSGIDAFLDLMEKAKWQAGQFATFKIFPPWLTFVLSHLLCGSYLKYAGRTTGQVLAPLTRDGRLATVLSAFGGDLGESLDDGSFCMQAAVLGHVLEGCYYPEGGPIQFVRGLVPTVRGCRGDVLVSAKVRRVVVEDGSAVGVQLVQGDVLRAKRGVVSDAGIPSTLNKLLPVDVVNRPEFRKLRDVVRRSGGGISHVFAFVGLNASSEELGLQSSSFYYIPWNETNRNMNATLIQEYYRDTLLNPNVMDVSAGMVFCTAKDPVYSALTMPGRSTVIVFSEARASDFLAGETSRGRTQKYEEVKQLIQRKMMRSLLINFPHLEPHVDLVEIGTPLTLLDYTLRTDTLGLRHTPDRMTSFDIRPDSPLPGLYFTGQDIAFAGWAGALTGAMVTAQKLLGYTLLDFARGKTLMRDLGRGDVEDMIQGKVALATRSGWSETVRTIFGNLIDQWRKLGN